MALLHRAGDAHDYGWALGSPSHGRRVKPDDI